MSAKIQPPKGTRDFYPADMAVQNHIFSAWRRVCARFGFQEYEGPSFEHLELYTGKSGDEIVGQLYNFKDKGDRDLALRYAELGVGRLILPPRGREVTQVLAAIATAERDLIGKV